MGFVVGVTRSTRPWPKSVIRRECHEARIVDGLWTLPAQHHRLLAIVLARCSEAVEVVEGLDMAIEQRMKVRPVVESIIPSMAIGESISEDLQSVPCAILEIEQNSCPVALGHLARLGLLHRGR